MLTRRSLLAGTAALAAGCSTVGPSFSPPSTPREAQLTWAVFGGYLSLLDTQEISTSQERALLGGLAALAEDKENPFGPQRGRYTIRLHYAKEWPEPEPPPQTYEAALESFAETLEAISADLVALPPILAKLLGEKGLVLPLDRFIGGEKSEIEGAYYPSVLEPGRGQGGLYALPVGAQPQMMRYDAAYFAEKGESPPDGNWNWDDLVSTARRLTKRNNEGEVTRWGVVTHGGFIGGIWWVLWQNQATLMDEETFQCRLHEPAAVGALQFFHDLLHTYRVSPAVESGELYKLRTGPAPPFAMQYDVPFLGMNSGQSDFRLAELPRGKVPAVPVSPDLSIAIAARTEKADAAYTALRGVVGAMQRFVHVPAERETLARLGEFRKRLRPEEVTALQRSMEHGHAMPEYGAAHSAMGSIVAGLLRGDDAAAVADTACAAVDELQKFCSDAPDDIRCTQFS